MSGQSIKVVVGDTDPAIIKALSEILAQDTRLEVAGSASEGSDLLYKVKTLNPSVVLTDIVYPGFDGAELVRLLRAQNPNTAVLVVSPRAVKGDPLTAMAMAAGGFDFVERPAKAAEMDRLGRVILTKVFVAANSKNKEAARSASASAQLPPRFLLVEVAGNRLSFVREAVAGFTLKLTPTVLMLVRTPSHKMDQLFKEVEPKARGPLGRPKDGDFLVQGRVYLVNQEEKNLFVERRPDGWLQLKAKDKEADAPAGEETPSVRTLAESLGAEFGGSLMTLMVGVSAPTSIDVLNRVKELGGRTAVEDKSQALLDLVAAAGPEAGIGAKITLPELLALVNEPAAAPAKS